jgi:hypothetical protein
MVEFVGLNAGSEDKSQGVDVVMNEDGTMQVAAGDDDDDSD